MCATGSGQSDMAHSLAANLALDDLNATLFADYAAMLHALVFSAVALVVLYRSKNLGTEKTILLGLEGSVVDGFRLLDLALRPVTDLLRAGKHDSDCAE